MADTGAPYFIPYVEPTDLVRDYPAADEASADAIAAALGSIPVLAGIGSNVVQTVKTDTFATSSDTFQIVTGLSADITPTADSSKILVIVQITTGLGNSSGYGHFGMLRGATEIYRGDALATNPRSVFGGGTFNVPNALQFGNFSASMVFLDSPATAASTTYNVIARRATNGQALVNRSVTVSAESTNSGASSITLIEVAA